MAPVKEGRLGKPQVLPCPAPARSLASPVLQSWLLAEEELRDELALLERIQSICREYGERCLSRAMVGSYQDLPPGAVSLMDPPDRAWLVRLQLAEQVWNQTPGEVEIIVTLRDGEAGLILR